MKYEVYEMQVGRDDVLIADGLTKEDAEMIVSVNPKIRVIVPSIING